MSETKTTDSVDDALDALSGPAEGGERTGDALRDLVKRAREEFDQDSAKTSGEGLIERLQRDPYDVRVLEALIVLGLAHPNVLKEFGVPLGQEGKRLAVLLERRQEVDRAHALLEMLAAELPTDKKLTHQLASMLRRTGNADRLIERYLSRAREAVDGGRPMDAIPWLQEALLVDRSRRDIARMIRDLRFAQVERRERNFARLKRMGLIALLCTAVAGAFVWELDCERQYAAIKPADMSDLESLRTRLASLDSLMDSAPMWLGMMKVSTERAELRVTIQKIVSAKADAERALQEQHDRRIEQAEAALNRAKMKSENGDFPAALAAFKESLTLAPADWVQREAVQKNIDAISNWETKNNGEARR